MAEEVFVIEDDKAADWALQAIAEHEKERDRLISLANDQINDLEMKIEEITRKCDNDTGYLKSCLYDYFTTVKTKETKTQKSYKLLSGTLVFKKPSVKINHNDEKLIAALDGTEYVETKKSLKWGEYKKNLGIEGDVVIDLDTGEVIEACTVEEVPGSFGVKY